MNRPHKIIILLFPAALLSLLAAFTLPQKVHSTDFSQSEMTIRSANRCSADHPVDVQNSDQCSENLSYEFSKPELQATVTAESYWGSDEHATEEARHHATEDAHHSTTGEPDVLATAESHLYGESTHAAPSPDLYQDLTEYLAGEGITAPTPGQIGASGAALATLLAGWLLLNHLSGVSAQTSIEVIEAWSHSEVPPQTAPEQPQEDSSADQLGEQPEEQPPDSSMQPPDSVPEQDELPEPGQPAIHTEPDVNSSKPEPAGPTTEDQALQSIQNVQDLDDAVRNTRSDFEAFYNNIPESVRNSNIWQNNVRDKYDQIRDMLAQGELGTSRTWLNRAEELLVLRNEIENDLDHLPPDSVEAIVWTERTLQALGHFTTDTYQTLVTDPAKNAGSAVLPSELAQHWNNAMDELNHDLSEVAQGISQLPREGAQLLTHHNLQQQAQQMMESSEQGTRNLGQEVNDLYGPRDVPVEYPDFWGRGTRKVQELWDHTMNSLFGGN